MRTKNRPNSAEIGLKRALAIKLSIIGGKAILPIFIGLLGLAHISCGDPATTEETRPETETPAEPGLMVSEFTTPDESRSWQRQFTIRLNTEPKADVQVGIDVTISLITNSEDDPAYNNLRLEIASVTLPPSPAYDLYVHDARTPKPESVDRVVEVWFTVHPDDSVIFPTQSNITIAYTVEGGSEAGKATAGLDYTAPDADSTVMLPAGDPSVSIPIELIFDNADTGDETFTVTITRATAADGSVVALADNSATVTIGDPDRSHLLLPQPPAGRWGSSLLSVLCPGTATDAEFCT